MGPKRKKSKPNPPEEIESATATGIPNSQTPVESAPASKTTSVPQDEAASSSASASARPSWYASSWRSKASPVTRVARESISVTQGATSGSSESARRPNSISKSMRGSRKSVPLAAEATRVHATSDASSKSRSSVDVSSEKKDAVTTTAPELVMEDAVLPPEPGMTKVEPAKEVSTGAWFAWWSRPDGHDSDSEKKAKKPKLDIEQASETPLPGITPVQSMDDTQPMEGIVQNARDFEGIGSGPQANHNEREMQEVIASAQQPATRSWFGLWSSSQNQPPNASASVVAETAKETPPEITVSSDPLAVEQSAKISELGDIGQEPQKQEANDRTKPSGWAFWSSNKIEDPSPTPGGTQKQVGELAVADTPSQNNPEAAQFNEQRDPSGTRSAKKEPQRTGSLLKPGKRSTKTNSSKSAAKEPAESAAVSASLPGSASSSAPPTTPATSELPTPSRTPPPQSAPIEASSILTRLPQSIKQSSVQSQPNLVLPTFDSTFPVAPNPGYIERLSSYLAQAMHIPGAPSSSPPLHVYRSTTTPKIKKAVALGIHGFFPGALIQKFIGQPKGTSVRLSKYAANAIKTWCSEHQGEGKDEVEIEKVALEGEGTISDRVATLWKLLLNWLSHLRQADFILIACHSQGVPVAIMLVAKLIQLGALSSTVRLGICALAGINLGPFLEYKLRLFGGVALELFDFCDSSSRVSKVYADSLELCLRHGVRITYVGSLDDQLVSLESALNMPVSHPYINRAVFVDGQVHAPNFLTHLVVFAIKLRNLGVSDHGLIRQLSGPLAGSLVGGDGHSRIYDEPEAYRLAIDFALRSTDVTSSLQASSSAASMTKNARRTSAALPTSPALAENLRTSSLTATLSPPPQQVGVSPIIASYEPPPVSASANPFVLPWAVRGMLEEEMVKREMTAEVEELVQEFEAWRPTSKVLRDVRWRLEGVRNMV